MIESERLFIRPADDGDFDFLHHLHSDPEVMKFILGRIRTEEESRGYLAELMQLYEAHKMGQFMVFDKATNTPLGRCGYSLFYSIPGDDGIRVYRYGADAYADRPEREKLVELGYTFARESWGKGYASEAASALFAYGRDELKLPAFTSIINQNNIGSIAVAERNGLVRGDTGRLLRELCWLYSKTA